MPLNSETSAPATDAPSAIETDPGRFSLSDFLVGDSKDPLKPPPIFTKWHQAGEWAIELYEPQMLAPAEVRTMLNYGGQTHPGINLFSYNYFCLPHHPESIAAARETLDNPRNGAG